MGNLRTNLVTAAFASYLHFNPTLSSKKVDFQALVDLSATSSIPKRQFGGLFSTEGVVVRIHRRKDDCMLSDCCTFSPLLNISCRRSKHEENGKQGWTWKALLGFDILNYNDLRDHNTVCENQRSSCLW